VEKGRDLVVVMQNCGGSWDKNKDVGLLRSSGRRRGEGMFGEVEVMVSNLVYAGNENNEEG
jgi:hypothetical protein